ncbi:MAG: Asp-tRNA(Asn)/Glu-tRNA(Gln) amidotransferase subunit GatB [Verrucomicrobia bacterium]|nr:MAG: Asp-tRNA(Asn)/Glu-tRNA(Gln) amidotransferase subunit GatB [Verrucomicrobiota bacterium]
MNFVANIGLEVHVQLKTRTKIFCGCPTTFGAPPNTRVCPVCLGYPGAMPAMNSEAIRLTVFSGLMLGCKINPYSKMDRKNYYYPDMPKNYQISQYDQPLCLGGGIEIKLADGSKKMIGLTRIHIEEDVGKNMHFAASSGIDFNRAGTPLMEIVTEPDIASADEALAFLEALKEILAYGGVSDVNLEEGNLRCDVNSSVRPVGQDKLGTKTELKNMNTFKGVYRALSYEITRQISELEKGGRIRQETRRWDDLAGVTLAMRSKEEAHDYRYFPEPDLLPIVLTPAQIDDWARALPELPENRRARMMRDYGIPEYDANVLAVDQAVANYFEATAKLSKSAKSASNWIMTTVLAKLTEQHLAIGELKITPAQLASLVNLVEVKIINISTAKEVFEIMFAQGGEPEEIVKAKGLAQVSDTGAIEKFVDEAIAANAKTVADYKGGKEAALKALIGQVMKLSKGKANPGLVNDLLKRKLS